MNRRPGIILLCLIFFIGLNADAQDRKQISLQQAVDLSLQHSNTLKISGAKITAAEAELRAAKDLALPDVKVSGSYLRLGGANVDLKNRGGPGGSSTPTVNQALYGIANVTYPIYAGGRIKYGIESAKFLEQAAKLSAEHDKEAIIYNTTSAYTNLYKAGAMVILIRESLKASVQRDSVLSRLEQNGLLARNDLLKAALKSSDLELTLLEAENDLAVSNINMALLLGLPENTDIETDSSFVGAKQDLKPFAEMEAQALQHRKDVQALGFQKKAVAVAVKSARGEAYPSLALTGGYIAADIPKLITVTNAVNIGIGVQYNLASLWKTNTKLLQAKARETEITAKENILADGIRLELNRDYRNYILAEKKTAVYEKAIVQAKENYRITKNKYDNNLVTVTDLLDADVALLQTRLNTAAARADAALAYNKLLQTTGILSK